MGIARTSGVNDPRQRRAQLAVLEVIGRSTAFRDSSVLKGALQVEALTGQSRSTRDVDLAFTSLPYSLDESGRLQLQQHLEKALRFGLPSAAPAGEWSLYAVSVKKAPPGKLPGRFGHDGFSAKVTVQRRGREQLVVPIDITSGDLIGPVMILAGRYADRATYDQLRALARRALTTEGKARAYRGLQSALDPDLLADTLLMSLGDEMPVSEANQNLTALADHSENPAAVARYTMDNFAALIEHLGNFEIYGYLPGIMKTLSDADQADALMAFTAQSLPADALPIAARTAEGIRDRAAFKQRALSIIDAWVITHLAQTLDKDIPASTPWLLP